MTDWFKVYDQTNLRFTTKRFKVYDQTHLRFMVYDQIHLMFTTKRFKFYDQITTKLNKVYSVPINLNVFFLSLNLNTSDLIVNLW